MKAQHASQAQKLEQIPNIGPSIANDLRQIGIQNPKDLIGKDGIRLWEKLCQQTKTQHDPCVADVFLSAIDFMEGSAPQKWWAFTQTRKQRLKTK